MMIRSVTRRFGTTNVMIRYDPERQNDNYLDAKIERVSARQTETPEVLWNHDPLCCGPKLVMKLIAQKLSRVPPLPV